MLLSATGNVGGRILDLLVRSPRCKKVVVTRRNVAALDILPVVCVLHVRRISRCESNHLSLLLVRHHYSFAIAVSKAGRSTLDMISFIGDSTKKAFPVDTAMRSRVGTRYTFWPPLPESITVSTRR